MQRETVEQILQERRLTLSGIEYTLPEGEVANLLIGRGRVSALPGIVGFSLHASYFVVRTRKGTNTYIEYDLLHALSFESKEVADRRTGFV